MIQPVRNPLCMLYCEAILQRAGGARVATIAEFQKIYIDVNNILRDSIEIYTRPIKPITNFIAQVDTPWVTALKWSASEEINEAFQKYELYRSTETLNNFILISSSSIFTQ